MNQRPRYLKLRNVLNIVFMLLAVATVLVFFFYKEDNRQFVIFTVGSIAVMVKLAEVMIRITYSRGDSALWPYRYNRCNSGGAGS